MTRKHFTAIAALYEGDPTLRDHAERMATWLRTQNPGFKRERFLRACGYGDQS